MYLAFGLGGLLETNQVMALLHVPVMGPTAEFELASTYGGLNLGLGFFLFLSLFVSSLRSKSLGFVILLNSSYVVSRAYLTYFRLPIDRLYMYIWAFEAALLVVALLALIFHFQSKRPKNLFI